jgi:arylformamidase
MGAAGDRGGKGTAPVHDKMPPMIATTPSTRPDPRWLDAQYNNRALVPEHAAHFARWSSESAQARAAGPALLDLSYGHGAGETLDVFPASRKRGAPLAPVLVFIHGGYWRSLDKADHSFLAPAFVQQGACVVVPNYALCPAVTIPDIVMQMVRALEWTYRHMAVHGGDPQRITVVGHSAGGHLAAMLLACRWAQVAADLPEALVKNALSISGLYDLEPVRRTPFLQDSLRLTPAQVRQASPALLPAPPIRDGRGQLYSVAGGEESSEFLRHNQVIQSAWGEAVVPVCEALPGLNHFSVLEALAQPSHRLHRLALELLA